MQVINVQDRNYFYCSSSVMNGMIRMSAVEFNEAYAKLKEWNDNNGYEGIKDNISLGEPLEYVKILCIGVSNTKRLFSLYSLPRYKLQNYAIIITK